MLPGQPFGWGGSCRLERTFGLLFDIVDIERETWTAVSWRAKALALATEHSNRDNDCYRSRFATPAFVLAPSGGQIGCG